MLYAKYNTKKVSAKVLASCRFVNAYENTNTLQIINRTKLTVIYEYTKFLGFFSFVFVTKIKAKELTANSSATIPIIGISAFISFEKTK
jgi:hypothetical protein